MPFAFSDKVIMSSQQFSRLVYSNDDHSVGLTVSEKEQVELLVNAAQEQINGYIGFSPKQATYTELRDLAGQDEIVLTNSPVTAVASVTISDSLVDPSSYEFDEDSIVFLHGPTGRGRKRCRIVYTAGWSDADMPADLKTALAMQFALLNRAVNPGSSGAGFMVGIQQVSKQGETQTKDSSLSKDGIASEVKGILSRYRRIEAGMVSMSTRVT